MANLFNYLAWRGDLPLDKIPFCELDAAVLTRLSYLPLDMIVSADFTEKITLQEATERALAIKKPSDYIWKGRRSAAPDPQHLQTISGFEAVRLCQQHR